MTNPSIPYMSLTALAVYGVLARYGAMSFTEIYKTELFVSSFAIADALRQLEDAGMTRFDDDTKKFSIIPLSENITQSHA